MDISIHSTAALTSGHNIPLLGLGAFKIPDGPEAVRVFFQALESGYRHIDTARVYGNEASVGKAIRQSGVPREEIFLTTKLWNEDQGYKKARKALEESLQQLQTNYVDLFLIHWPVEGMRMESWRALEDMHDEGLCRNIGVSNYMKRHLAELLMHCRIKPAVNQIEMHPFIFGKREDLVHFCRKNDIHISAYSPLTKGLKINDPRLAVIARRYFKSPAQILIRWALQEGFSVLPKSADKERQEENLRVFDFNLPEEDMMTLHKMNEGLVTGWDPTDMP
jgi:diketogulonate reductase-like aldo/keto reductase